MATLKLALPYKSRAYWRNELARCINRAAHATRCAVEGTRGGVFYDVEGCKQTAHDYIVAAIAAREMLKRIDGNA